MVHLLGELISWESQGIISECIPAASHQYEMYTVEVTFPCEFVFKNPGIISYNILLSTSFTFPSSSSNFCFASKLRAVSTFRIRRSIKQDNFYLDEETLRLLILERLKRSEDLYLNRYNSSFHYLPVLLPWSITINILLRFFVVLNIKITSLNRSSWLALSFVICPNTCIGIYSILCLPSLSILKSSKSFARKLIIFQVLTIATYQRVEAITGYDILLQML